MSKRNFTECFPNEDGAFNIQNSNLWIKEIGTESDAMKALIELVRLKDHPTTLESAYKLDDFYSYQRKFELAWEAARKLIESKK